MAFLVDLNNKTGGATFSAQRMTLSIQFTLFISRVNILYSSPHFSFLLREKEKKSETYNVRAIEANASNSPKFPVR